MSVVVAIKHDNKIYVGADSQVTKGGTRSTLQNPNNYKIWKVKGVDNCIMGHVGVIRDANIVRLIDNLVTEYEQFKDVVDYEFVVKKVVPTIFEELKMYGYMKNDKYIDAIDSKFLFAYKDKLYTIFNDGCVIEVDDCIAIGSGSCEAIGSLLSTDNENPKERIIKAIKTSAACDIYVDYPIILTDTQDTKFDIITEKNEKSYLEGDK